MTKNEEICAHEGCICKLDVNFVEDNNKKYCSQKCAEGKSCEHVGCSC